LAEQAENGGPLDVEAHATEGAKLPVVLLQEADRDDVFDCCHCRGGKRAEYKNKGRRRPQILRQPRASVESRKESSRKSSEGLPVPREPALLTSAAMDGGAKSASRE
jgi:hypothetical protein